MALTKPGRFCMLPNVHCCVVFVLSVTTLFFPLSARFVWNKEPPDPVEGVLGENLTLEWNFTISSTNDDHEKFDYFMLIRQDKMADMVKYCHEKGLVTYTAFKGSVFMAANATPVFVLINLQKKVNRGTFCCKVGTTGKQQSGKNYVSCVSLKLLERPGIVTISRNQTVNESNNVILSCNITGEPSPNVTWTKSGDDGNKFKPGSFLPLKNISRGEDGLYWCTAENRVGKATGSVRVTVQYAPSITPVPETYNITEGDDLVLTCAADGRPPPVVTWRKDDGSSIVKYPNRQTLNITNANRTEAGNYRCTATNGIGKDAVATTLVNILYKPTGTHLTSNVTRNTVTRGLPVTFHCSSDSVPPPVLELYFEKLFLGHFINGQFTTARVKASDQGMYECVASNIVGKGKPATLNLIVLVPPSIEHISHDTIVNEDDDVTLFCNSTGNPRPNITWTFLNGSHEEIIGTKESLTLFYVKRHQTGTYQCTASNDVTSPKTANVHVTINYSPRIDTRPASQSVNESSDLELFCNATGYPPPQITWSKEADPSVPLSVGEVLNVKSMNKTNSGVYQCRASNGIRTDVLASANVTVNYKAIGTRLTSNATRNAMIRSLPATLRCSADGVPPPVLELRFKNSSLGRFIDGMFTIEQVKASHEGIYECVPKNILGTGYIATLYLTVAVPLSFEYTSNDTTVNETDDVMLFCNSTGNPRPNITWTFLSGSEARIIGTGESLTLSNVKRNQAGTYQCTTSNDVTSPKTANVHVTVNYKPEIKDGVHTTIKSWINHETKVTCAADGVPVPDIVFTRNGKVLPSMPSKSGARELTLKPEDANDFGEYLCTAQNLLGSTQTIITIEKLVPPAAPEILKIVSGLHNMEIHWQASDSNPDSPVLDYLVMVGEKGESGSWKNCTRVHTSNRPLTCAVDDLKSGTIYFVQVAARNVVGYSEFIKREAKTKKITVKEAAKDRKQQQQLSRAVIDGIIAGAICFCSLVVVTFAIIKHRRPCHPACKKKSMDLSLEECASGHDNLAWKGNPETDEIDEQV